MILLASKGVTMDRIITNKIKCKKCGDIVESKSVHDYVECSCGAVAVDGGHEYLRRVGKLDDIEDLSEVEKDGKIAQKYHR